MDQYIRPRSRTGELRDSAATKFREATAMPVLELHDETLEQVSITPEIEISGRFTKTAVEALPYALLVAFWMVLIYFAPAS